MKVLELELEDFNNAILLRGLDPSDFELGQLEEPMQGCEVQPLMGWVIVRRKTTGIQKTYKAGDWAHWSVDFVDDLRKGVFD